MTDPAREPYLFVRVYQDIVMAGEANRRGDVAKARDLVLSIEQMSEELANLLANK